MKIVEFVFNAIVLVMLISIFFAKFAPIDKESANTIAHISASILTATILVLLVIQYVHYQITKSKRHGGESHESSQD